MTNKELMLNGYLYNSMVDEGLFLERLTANDLCYKYNNIKPSKTKKRDKVLRKIIGKAGKNVQFLQPFYCDYGYNIEVGDNFFANYGCIFLDPNKITFGNNVMIAPNCVFSTAGHALDAKQRISGEEIALPINVGDNVWIGASVTVLPGVKIGSNTIIGGGSLVNKDIPDGVIAIGVPCKVLRKITPEDAYKYKIYKE